MKIEIFDVEHGACALITADNYSRIMIDCGHNATTGWRPGSYLRSIGVTYLENLVITNYDEDHVSGICDLFDRVTVGWITRNTSVTPDHIRWLKTQDGMGPGIDRLIYELTQNFLPAGSPRATAPHQFSGVAEKYFHHTPQEFQDENNLSLLAKFTCNGTNIMFTGDMERAGWLKMIPTPGFIGALQNIDVFIAPHHGRLSGWCEDLFWYFTPTFTVVSDKSMEHTTQETRDLYAAKTRGGIFNGEAGRKFVTTRSDGDLIITPGTGDYLFGKLAQPFG